jgi:hypothetical protein
MRTVKSRPIILFAALLGVAGLLPLHEAAAASGGGSVTPALQKQLQHAASQHAQAADEGDGAADEIMARDQLDAAITSAPGTQAPSAALAAAQHQAAALPAQGGSWSEISRRPFLDDPVPGRTSFWSNYGSNYGLISGRMTAATARGRIVYSGGADGGVWVTSNRGATWRPVSNGLPASRSARSRRTPPTAPSGWALAKRTPTSTPLPASGSTALPTERRPGIGWAAPS